MPILIKYSGAVPSIAKKEANRILKEAWEQEGLLWHRTMRPKHFETGAEAAYNYRPRSGSAGGTGGKAFWKSYSGRKQRYKHHQRPLVWSGESERQTRTGTISSTSKGTRVSMTARKLNFRPKGWPYSLREELTRINARESMEVQVDFDHRLNEKFAAITATETPNVGA